MLVEYISPILKEVVTIYIEKTKIINYFVRFKNETHRPNHICDNQTKMEDFLQKPAKNLNSKNFSRFVQFFQ